MGNFFQFSNIRNVNRTVRVREERIKREGSAYYTYTPAQIAASGSDVLRPSTYFPASKKYEPLDFVEIVNNDAVDISIAVNGRDSFLCLAGTIRTIENQPLWELRITNKSASTATTVGKIVLTLQRQPLTMDRWIRR